MKKHCYLALGVALTPQERRAAEPEGFRARQCSVLCLRASRVPDDVTAKIRAPPYCLKHLSGHSPRPALCRRRRHQCRGLFSCTTRHRWSSSSTARPPARRADSGQQVARFGLRHVLIGTTNSPGEPSSRHCRPGQHRTTKRVFQDDPFLQSHRPPRLARLLPHE